MCGICGFTNLNHSVNDPIDVVREMNASLSHRGPDGEGYAVVGNQHIQIKSDESIFDLNSLKDTHHQVFLGHARLSIIDVSGGTQPISNEDNSIVIVVNGEIYNHNELRAELELKGHVFKTHSDSESILHLYEEYGSDCFNKLNGMFACAIWDNRKKKMYLGRDRFGQKPLYYSIVNGELIFGSELKAVTSHPMVKTDIDNFSLSQYFAYEYVPAPRTIYTNINKLSAGCYFEFSPGQKPGTQNSVPQSYWSYDVSNVNHSITEKEASERLSELFEQSVKRRLMSDVPLGVFLSGGLDSSMTAAMACRHAQGRVKTFSIAFDDPSFDESSHARKVANFLGTDHYEKRFHVDELYQSIDEILSRLDEPMADASLLPTYLLSKFTREHVTVALGGDGADELFCGYPTFQAHKVAQLYRMIPGFMHNKIISPLVNKIPVNYNNISFDFKLKQFLKGVRKPAGICHQLWMGSFSKIEIGDLLPQVMLGERDVYAPSRVCFESSRGADDLSCVSQLYVSTYLQDDILTKVDRASMAVSLEARTPFLDVDFTNFAATIPGSMKLKGLTTKHILKKTARGLIPDDIIDRPKKGFGIPIGKWFRHELKDRITDPSFKEGLERFGVRSSKVDQLVHEHLSGFKDNRKQLWTLFVLNSFA